MNSAELGKRIKEARIARKMTQSELVGDFITRNMLSRIESGNACPSVRTLEYLAQRLGLPAGSLMEVDDGIKSDKGVSEIVKAKNLYFDEDYEASKKLCEKLFDTELFDEAYAISAKCCIAQAKAMYDRGDMLEAAELAKQAYFFAEKGFYASREVRTEAALLQDKIADSKIK